MARALLLLLLLSVLPLSTAAQPSDEDFARAEEAFERGDFEEGYRLLRGGEGGGPAWHELAEVPEDKRVRVHDILEAVEKEESQRAMDLLVLELTEPSVDMPYWPAQVRAMLVRMHGARSQQLQLGTQSDDEARRLVLEGRALAPDPLTRAALDGAYAAYFAQTGRNGFASIYAERQLQVVQKYGSAYDRLDAHDLLAGMYADIGQLALRDHHRELALAAAEAHMPGGSEAEPVATDAMGAKVQLRKIDRIRELYFKRMNDLATSGRYPETGFPFSMFEMITEMLPGPRFWHWARASSVSSQARAFEDARDLLDRARETAKSEGQDPDDWYIACRQAELLLAEGSPEAAEPLSAHCLSEQPAPGILDLRLRGEALEGVGRYAEAKEVYLRAARQAERLRTSYSVADRAGFYRGNVRAAHWGLIRVTALQAAASGADADLLRAIEASEHMRSRQLGDLLGRDDLASISPDRLAALRAQLAPDEAVLTYVLMSHHLVLLAWDRDRFVAQVRAHDGPGASNRLRELVAALADPKSDTAALTRELEEAGSFFLWDLGDLLRGKRRLLVLPDGALALVPFDLLIDPTDQQALHETRVVRTAPSLRYLAARSAEAEPTRGLFAVADPQFRGAPATPGAAPEAAPDAALRSLGPVRSSIAPLPATRTEVASIGTLFGDEPVDVLLGSAARESTFKERDLAPYRFVHLATHGILGGDLPGIAEPALVLAEERGEDGFLLASEAMRLDLRAELTVLSACKTGTGELVSGEGVMGMSRAFLLAGSRSVLVSLWEVDSKATEALMVAFYRRLRAGAPAAEALRDAKHELRDGTRHRPGGAADPGSASARRGLVVTKDVTPANDTSHPFYWAAFVLVGR